LKNNRAKFYPDPIRNDTTDVLFCLIQNVWSRTRLIGCGYANCPNSAYRTQVFCNYYPPYVAYTSLYQCASWREVGKVETLLYFQPSCALHLRPQGSFKPLPSWFLVTGSFAQ